MMIVISPAKSLDFAPQQRIKKHTLPEFLDDSQALIDQLAKMSKSKVAKLMQISDKLAELNVGRYREWRTPFTPSNAKQCLLAFQGDVYQGFDLQAWRATDFTYAQKHLRILSGLYGLLRPLDLIQPYRLEMGTKLKTKRGKDLYAFWGEMITHALDDAIQASRSKALVNLASNEYFRAVDASQLTVPLITPVFKDQKNGSYKVISFFAKKARGLMSDFMIRNRVSDPKGMKAFDLAGYRFDAASSDQHTFTFLRDHAE